MSRNNTSFTKIVDTVYNLPLDDKLELINLLEHNIAEERREEISKSLKFSQEENAKGKLMFSADIKKLKKML